MSQKPNTVFFSIGEKKLKMTVMADSEAHAAQIVRDKLKVLKVTEDPLEKVEDADPKSTIDKLFDWVDEVVEKVEQRIKD